MRATSFAIASPENHLQAALVRQRDVQSRGQRLVNLPLIAMATVVEVGIFSVISLGTLFVLQGSLSIAALFALVAIAMRFSEPLAQLTGLASVFDLMEIGLERIEALMSIPPLFVQTPPAQLNSFDITFENVSFRYADQSEWTLQDVSFLFA
ncbi:ABC transporter ATP-binding protein/permease [Chroococcidiopsis sp. TS-821]|uniref:ABC transporter ATP-binding protein/permease n=1 Tax=Chroococcidiopsis sp. TS-821 TaxID=1378066 RepID=UPI000D495F1B|nr:ABC transporter ATP-binding protein/permease [Chroococcidiopsis sp. TS-821]PPS45811.1 hypothetical protein B1A85_06120 [Chroococcidiopsis sp. TS-821]